MTDVHPKVVGGAYGVGMGGAIATVAVWAFGLGGIAVPPEVAAAFATIACGIAGFLTAYFTPSNPSKEG